MKKNKPKYHIEGIAKNKKIRKARMKPILSILMRNEPKST